MKTTLLCILTATFSHQTLQAAPDLKATAARIDELVNARLSQEKITPNKPVSDEVFVRRVHLDIIGRIPTLRETTEFLQSSDADKRSKLIDSLLASEGYAQHFFNYWADILRMKSNVVGGAQSLPAYYGYANWLKSSLRENKPYDQMVRDVITASGKSYENGAIGFYIRDYNMPLDNMAVTTQIFLGTSMVCAQCHNHPFDKWTQMEYYQMAAHTYGMTGTNNLTNPLLSQAIYGGTTRGKNSRRDGAAAKFNLPEGVERRDIGRAMSEILRPLRYNTVIDESSRRGLRLPHDYQYPDARPKQQIEPVIPAAFSKDGKIVGEGRQPSAAYAAWMTSRENPRFTTVIANRLWKKLMGRGLIEPVDEITDSTVPSNPRLMSFLEETLKSFDYDMKMFLRVVLNSHAYQREAHTKDVEPGEVYHFPGPLLRRMSAEQIWDSMVALHKPNPDAPGIETRIEAEISLRRVEWLDRALNTLTPKQMHACTVRVAQKQKELAAEVRAAQENMEAASRAKDEDAIRKARKAIQGQRKHIDEAVKAIVYDTGFQRFAELAREGRLGELIQDADFAREVATAIKAKKSGEDLTMDEALAILARQRRARFEEQVKARMKADAVRFTVDDPNEKAALTAWENFRDSVMLRAADLRSPAPNGHFLREFGQSDRELVENANDEASVGQALMLLNGKIFSNLMNRHTVIARSMDKAKKDGGGSVIDIVYLSLLSRKASAEEKALLQPIADNADATDRGDVLWTVLNTRQFFFIQ
ncbi:MAG: DUF1549 domain-containing protein [Verrucomicrobiaceae bacterium]|nr:DUF1549 domain-containing protein [Verrucomicrobiaceae bacterium]